MKTITFIFYLFIINLSYSQTDSIYTNVDIFPTEDTTVESNFSKNFNKYSKGYKKRKIPLYGFIIYSFVVEKTGAITNVKLDSSSNNKALNSVVLRTIKRSKRWNPGFHNGKRVRVRMYHGYRLVRRVE